MISTSVDTSAIPVVVAPRQVQGGGGGDGPAVLASGARIVFAGHSKVSQISSPGMRNFGYWTITQLAGIARLAIGGDQGIGGNTIADYSARKTYTSGQAPDVTFVLIPHNSLSLGASTVNSQLDTLKADLEAANPSKYLIFATEPPSAAWPAADATLVAVNSHIAAYDGTNGGYTKYCDFATGFDYATMTYSSAGDVNIHPNEVGANFMAERAAAVISTLITSMNLESVLNEITATGDHGADACPTASHNMTFSTGGVKAGTGSANISGDIADKFTITNNSTGLTVVCSIDTQSGYNRQIIDITGTGVTETTLTFATTNSSGARAAINSVIGDAIESLWGFSLSHTDGSSAPSGLLQHGALLGTSIGAFSLGSYTSADTKISGAQPFAQIAQIARTYPKVQPVALTNLNPTFGVRVSGTVNIRLILWKPIVRKTELTAYALPKHMGSDGIMGADARVGFRNGTTLTNGNAIAIQSGAWSGGALNYGAVRIYHGGTAGDAGIGTGSLIATISEDVWSWTAAVSTGESYYVELDVTNSFGSTTARSASAKVAA